jgi:rsbT antagonist protein RsbS
MARVPIVRIEDTLIATVQEGLRDSDALDLQVHLGQMLERTQTRGVLIDISVVETVDSFLGRLLNDVARQSHLLGAHTVVVGVQPPVAVTLVELGLNLKGVYTALDVDRGMALLRRLADGESRQRGRYGR